MQGTILTESDCMYSVQEDEEKEQRTPISAFHERAPSVQLSVISKLWTLDTNPSNDPDGQRRVGCCAAKRWDPIGNNQELAATYRLRVVSIYLRYRRTIFAKGEDAIGKRED